LQTKQESVAARFKGRKETSVETVFVSKKSSGQLVKGGSLDAREEEERFQKSAKIKKHPLVRNASVRARRKSNVGIPIPVSWHEAALVSKCGHGRREVVCTDPGVVAYRACRISRFSPGRTYSQSL
jgi:hypothetical protein